MLDDLDNNEYTSLLDAIPPLNDLLETYLPNLDKEDGYFMKEFVLWALVEFKLLSKKRFSKGTQYKDPYGSFISGI